MSIASTLQASGNLTLDPTGYAGLALDRLARQACEVLGTEQSCLMVRDPSNPRMAIAAAGYGVRDDVLGSRLTLDRGPVGHAFAFGRAAAGRDSPSSSEVTACAPIGDRPEVRGALSATSSATRGRFSDREVTVLRELAEIAADTLDHAGTRAARLVDVSAQLDRILDRLSCHDDHTGRHSAALVGIALALGQRLGMGRACLLELELAALLHDLGKLTVPVEILSKPGPLTEEEWAVIKRHPLVGAELLRQLPGLEPVATIVRYHHERWDGEGYPLGLAGDQIPLASRIVSVCDSFHAMTSDRPYRAALTREYAFGELEEKAGEQFDPSVVNAFDEQLVDRVERTRRR